MISNVNPDLNDLGGTNVHVLNMLDLPQMNTLAEQLTVPQNGFMEGMGVLDWGGQ